MTAYFAKAVTYSCNLFINYTPIIYKQITAVGDSLSEITDEMILRIVILSVIASAYFAKAVIYSCNLFLNYTPIIY